MRMADLLGTSFGHSGKLGLPSHLPKAQAAFNCSRSNCPQEKDITSKCALINLPKCYQADPSNNAGSQHVPEPFKCDDFSTLSVFIKCYTAPQATKALWFVQGGPGGTAQVFEGVRGLFF